ncbi:MAG TPA: hypothetical protein VGF55_08380 [Gemmataceae bacterium]|jgi:hypothetical protein
MSEFFATWKPSEVIGLAAALGGCLTVVLIVALGVWCSVRHAETAANLKRDMLQRGLSVDEIEHVLRAPAEVPAFASEKELEAGLASLLVQNEVAGPTVERVLRAYQATDPATKKAVYDSLEEIIGSEPSEDQLLAAVTALCPPRTGAPPAARFEHAPAGI